MLNKWSKAYWSAILQTQLKGKTLRVLAELNEVTMVVLLVYNGLRFKFI